jgi:hypothetical protein
MMMMMMKHSLLILSDGRGLTPFKSDESYVTTIFLDWSSQHHRSANLQENKTPMPQQHVLK